MPGFVEFMAILIARLVFDLQSADTTAAYARYSDPFCGKQKEDIAILIVGSSDPVTIIN
jgi:hypothetical protein